jgi:hypothetical protein
MKIISAFISMLFLASVVNGQSDSWKIIHNNKLLLNATVEDESKNLLQIKRTEFDKSGQLTIEYKEETPPEDWRRTIAIVDANDSTLFENTGSNTLDISNATMKELIGGREKIKIYTWSLPKDPAKAALVRVRRVHLCTISLD